MSALRAFVAWPSGASLLYLVSAACLLGGAALVLAPGSADEARLGERFGMLGVLMLYVGALAGLAGLVCRWQRGNHDAIALVVLLSLFLPGMHAGLSTIAGQQPGIAVLGGMIGLAISALICRLVQRHVTGAWSPWLVAPLAGIQAWNALAPGLLGLTFTEAISPEALMAIWLPGWWMQVAAGIALVVGALGNAAPAAGDAARPCIERRSLPWVMALGLLVASGLHQWLLTYAFNLGLSAWDLLAMPMLVVLAAGAIARRQRWLDESALAVLEGFAGVWAIIAITQVDFSTARPDADHLLHLLTYPPAIFGLMTLGLLGLATYRRHFGSVLGALVWGLGTVLIWGIEPETRSFNWLAVGWAMLGLAAIVLVLPRKLPPPLQTVALALLVLAAWTRHDWLAPTLVCAVAACRAGYDRRWLPLLIGGLPLAIKLAWILPGLLRAGGAWLAVVAAFLLLGAGTWMSWLRVRRHQQAQPTATESAPL